MKIFFTALGADMAATGVTAYGRLSVRVMNAYFFFSRHLYDLSAAACSYCNSDITEPCSRLVCDEEPFAMLSVTAAGSPAVPIPRMHTGKYQYHRQDDSNIRLL